ncbi:hypothetical protein [Bradyrhizobium sp. RDI18]|uniref:hypothetical protein n=1 Tax=Bradyrhizobium sp. RDI18 TaxID=3367400 RepID=UPI00372188BA
MQVSANAGTDRQASAKAAHIGRIIVTLPGPRLYWPTANFCPASEFQQARQNDESGAAWLLSAPYLLAPRYVVHTALAKVCDVLRAHTFSTSATIDETLILGCVWPLAAAT